MPFAPTLPDPATGPALVFDRSWQTTPNNVTRARRALLPELRLLDLPAATVQAIDAAVTEAATNTVYHAYVGRRLGHFRIVVGAEDDELNVTVLDDGVGFDPSTVVPGAGLPLIAALASRVETRERRGGGMRTSMTFPR